jgi:folate-dependent phosphoribosylglycinamide formyltransferase PurN
MRILTVGLTTRFAGKMINIHPSLLPAFRGLDTHERAIGGGVKLHGCTVHFVTPNLDEGPIIAQAALCVRPNDTPQTLAERVLVLEHEILPKTVAWVLDGHCTMEANHVTLDPSIIDDSFSFQR